MFRLPFAFIITGMISFVLFHLLTLADFAGWIAGEPESAKGWFHVHLLVLGWATMVAMGAVYQLINVVLQTELHSRKLGWIHYGLFTVGTTGLLAGFRTVQTQWIASFAVLAFAGIILFAWNIGATLWKAKQWNPVTISAACAVGYLCLAALSGMMMGLSFRFDILGELHERWLGTHIWLGAVGWFGLLITGFSYKLLPMFYLAHGYPVKLQQWVIIAWNAAVLLGAAGFLTGTRMLIDAALLVLTAGLAFYNIHISQIARHKHKKTPGAGIKWTVWSARLLLAVCAASTAAYLFNPKLAADERIVVFVLWVYLYGWVAITMMGYLSKIVPFLWWTHKYGPDAGKKKVPTMGQLLAEKPVHTGLSVVAIGLGGLLVGLGLDIASVITAAGSLLSAAAIVYMLMIARVFTR